MSHGGERPVLGVTAGDPAGIGGEIVLRTVTEEGLLARCHPVVFGSARSLERDAAILGMDVAIVRGGVRDADRAGADTIVVHDVDEDAIDVPPHGAVDARAGAVAFEAVRAAVAATLSGTVSAICTAPLNKEALSAAGHRYDGHTGLLAHLCQAPRVSMLLVGQRLRIAHVTTHMALREVPDAISEQRVRDVALITVDLLARLGMTRPRIAVAGLNPHAGEHGLFGDEEASSVAPAVEGLRAAGHDVAGPVPPDTVFVDALEGRYDAVVAMYHDQGHIPIKLIERDAAVNVTGGLPIVRTSVDHGTAFDIAGRGIARIDNMRAALRLALRLSGGA